MSSPRFIQSSAVWLFLSLISVSAPFSSFRYLYSSSLTLVERNDLICENTYAGKEIAIPDLQDTHYDIKGVTIAKLINCVRMYREIYELDNDSGQYIIRYAEREILKLLKNAQNAGRMIIDLLPKDVRNVLSA